MINYLWKKIRIFNEEILIGNTLQVRREKISERMKFLQELVPGCNKVASKFQTREIHYSIL